MALNSRPSLALHKEPEVAVGTMGIGLDYGGFGVQTLPADDVERILGAYPRLKMKERFADACCRLTKATGTPDRPTKAEIARLAYHFYEMRGRADGRDVDDWLFAEQQLIRHTR